MHDVVAHLQANARVHAKKRALVYYDNTITYAQLNEQSEHIAAALVACGAQPEKVYPILMDRGPAYVAALLGVMRAGAAAAPLSTTYPQERIDLIAHDCGSDLMVDDAFVKEALTAASMLQDEPARSSDSAALVVYTSGSTGRPKGIVHEHAELAAAIERR